MSSLRRMLSIWPRCKLLPSANFFFLVFLPTRAGRRCKVGMPITLMLVLNKGERGSRADLLFCGSSTHQADSFTRTMAASPGAVAGGSTSLLLTDGTFGRSMKQATVHFLNVFCSLVDPPPRTSLHLLQISQPKDAPNEFTNVSRRCQKGACSSTGPTIVRGGQR